MVGRKTDFNQQIKKTQWKGKAKKRDGKNDGKEENIVKKSKM